MRSTKEKQNEVVLNKLFFFSRTDFLLCYSLKQILQVGIPLFAYQQCCHKFGKNKLCCSTFCKVVNGVCSLCWDKINIASTFIADFVPCEFFLFPTIKRTLRENYFSTLEQAVKSMLVFKETFAACFTELFERMSVYKM